jgi:hypothetical protein
MIPKSGYRFSEKIMLKQDGAEGGPPQRWVPNNLRKGGNTSSIMLCNAPSIMQREAPGITTG